MALTELEPGPRLALFDRLLPADVPTRPRALAVLDGVLSGRVWADDPDDPSALLVVEEGDGTVYAGGDVTPLAARAALASVRPASGELIFGFSGPHDALRNLVPTEPFWSGPAIDFTERVSPDGEAIALEGGLLDGARAVPLEPALLPMTVWYEDTMRAFGSAERWAELSLGFAVMIGDEMVAECLAGPRTRGLLEMGVVTRKAHRRRGYGTLVSRLTARACEARGDRVWWNTNADNAPSLAIARRLGFRTERRYELVACHASTGAARGSQ
jgi:RimJ/RimL family protein N-acetyltransferase